MQLVHLLTSKRGMEVLKVLASGPKSRNEIARSLQTSRSAMSQVVKRLTHYGLVGEDGGFLELSSKGKIVVRICSMIEDCERFLNSFGEHLNLYTLDDIPEYLLSRIFELKEGKIIFSDKGVFRPHPDVVDSIAKSKTVRGYTPVVYPDYVRVFLKAAEKAEVEVVVSNLALSKLMDEFGEELKDFMQHARIFVTSKNFRFSFVLTDTDFYMSFFLRNGVLDYTKFFAWRDSNALRWGGDLFECVKANSQKLSF